MSSAGRWAILASTVVALGAVPAGAAASPYEEPERPVPERVADLLGRMTLAEKVGQMTQTERGRVYDDESPITTRALGSILSGGGSTPAENTPKA